MSYEAHLRFAEDVAREAGETMMRHFRTDSAKATWKRENDPVTIADTAINSLVIERVKATFPKDGILGEEESFESQREGLWIVDPLDGTLPYTVGLPIAAFLFTYLVEGRPKAAVAYNPWMDVMYSAEESKGAFCNGMRLKMPQSTTRFVEFIFWKGAAHRERLINTRDVLEREGFSPINFAGGISRFGLMEGRLYGFIYSENHPWDVAALDLLVAEAGGKLTGLDGEVLDYRSDINGAVAGTEEAHAALLQLINRK